MKMETRPNNDANEPAAPPKLVAALRRTQDRSVFVPPGVDAAILRAARERLGEPAPVRRFGFWTWLRWPAVATASLLVCVLAYHATRPLLRPRPSNYARADLNQDGRVDILDAFMVAREVQSGRTPPSEYDVNGDGRVDDADVQLLAQRAVKIEEGGRS